MWHFIINTQDTKHILCSENGSESNFSSIAFGIQMFFSSRWVLDVFLTNLGAFRQETLYVKSHFFINVAFTVHKNDISE